MFACAASVFGVSTSVSHIRAALAAGTGVVIIGLRFACFADFFRTPGIPGRFIRYGLIFRLILSAAGHLLFPVRSRSFCLIHDLSGCGIFLNAGVLTGAATCAAGRSRLDRFNNFYCCRGLWNLLLRLQGVPHLFLQGICTVDIGLFRQISIDIKLIRHIFVGFVGEQDDQLLISCELITAVCLLRACLCGIHYPGPTLVNRSRRFRFFAALLTRNCRVRFNFALLNRNRHFRFYIMLINRSRNPRFRFTLFNRSYNTRFRFIPLNRGYNIRFRFNPRLCAPGLHLRAVSRRFLPFIISQVHGLIAILSLRSLLRTAAHIIPLFSSCLGRSCRQKFLVLVPVHQLRFPASVVVCHLRVSVPAHEQLDGRLVRQILFLELVIHRVQRIFLAGRQQLTVLSHRVGIVAHKKEIRFIL